MKARILLFYVTSLLLPLFATAQTDDSPFGDVNNDGVTNTADVVAIYHYIITGERPSKIDYSIVDGCVKIIYQIESIDKETTIANDVTSFSSMKVDDGKEITPSTTYDFKNTGEHVIVWGLKDPEVLGMKAFAYCTSITRAILSDNIKTIGTLQDWVDGTPSGLGCFDECSNLKDCNIPLNLEIIGKATWCGTNLSGRIVLPNTVKTVGHYAFAHTPISEFVFGTGVTTTSMCMFEDCENLTNIYAYPTTCPPNEYMWKNYSFISIARNGTLHYPKGSDYSKWMQTSAYWLGYYGWKAVADLEGDGDDGDNGDDNNDIGDLVTAARTGTSQTVTSSGTYYGVQWTITNSSKIPIHIVSIAGNTDIACDIAAGESKEITLYGTTAYIQNYMQKLVFTADGKQYEKQI